MDQNNKEKIQTIIDFMYDGRLGHLQINEAVARVTYRMMEEALRCSQAMDLVPRPAGTKPALSYILKQLAQIALRLKTNGKIYISCKSAVALKWRNELQLAAMGL